MSAINVAKGVVDFWAGTLTFTGKPAVLWFDGIPLVDAAGNPVELPTAEYLDRGTNTEVDFEYWPTETTDFTIVARADTLEAALGIILGAKYNGSAPTAKAGLDFTQALTITNCRVMSVVPGQRAEAKEVLRNPEATLVHKVSQAYRVTLQRIG